MSDKKNSENDHDHDLDQGRGHEHETGNESRGSGEREHNDRDDDHHGAGSIPSPTPVTPSNIGSVTFEGETAGYKNAVGMYKIGPDGTISGVQILFANASLQGSGGDLIGGKSSAGVEVNGGEKVGFFIVPNGYSQKGMADILSSKSGSFKFVDADGKPGNVNGGKEMKLVFTSSEGKSTDVTSQYGTSTYHSADDGSKGLNGDGFNHVKVSMSDDGMKIGFEDLKGGGDKDYDDSIITFHTSKDAKEFAEKAAKEAAEKAAKEAAAKAAAEKAAADKAAAEKAAAEKAAADKAAADKAAAEKAAAEKAAADKAAADKAAADKAAADKAAADKAAAEKAAADKAAAEKAAADKAAADKAAAEKAAAEKAAADKAAAEKAAADKAAADKAAADKAAADKAAADKAAADKAAADKAAADKAYADAHAHDEAIQLHTHDALDVVTHQVITGSKVIDGINGGQGNDTLSGVGGNDTINGDETGMVTVPLSIDGSLLNAADANALLFTITGVPMGATLSHGSQNDDGSWVLTASDLKGLEVTTPDAANFTLHVLAVAADGSGLTAASDIKVALQGGTDDLISGNGGNDTLNGNAGDDVIYGSGAFTGVVHVNTVADNDVIHGGEGNDRIWGNAGDDKIWGDAGNDVMYGGKGNDVLNGGAGDNVVFGNSGDDVIVAGGGNDKVIGGSGFDTIDFSNATGSVKVDLHSHMSSGYGNDWIEGVEAVIGSGQDDIIWGDKRSNVLTGNGGNDTFGFHSGDVKKGNVDHITDFNKGDKLNLSEMLHGRTGDNWLHVTDGKEGTTVSVKIGTAFVDVVTLDGVHGMTASEMLKAGMILV